MANALKSLRDRILDSLEDSDLGKEILRKSREEAERARARIDARAKYDAALALEREQMPVLVKQFDEAVAQFKLVKQREGQKVAAAHKALDHMVQKITADKERAARVLMDTAPFEFTQYSPALVQLGRAGEHLAQHQSLGAQQWRELAKDMERAGVPKTDPDRQNLERSIAEHDAANAATEAITLAVRKHGEMHLVADLDVAGALAAIVADVPSACPVCDYAFDLSAFGAPAKTERAA